MAELRGPTVVVASDAFKGSLTSLEVADAVRLGLLDVAPSARVAVVPVADGGEGTVAAALAAGAGWSGVSVEVHGPTGEPVAATLAVRGGEERVVSGLDSAASWLSSVESPTEVSSRGSVSSRATTVLVEMADACGLGRLPGGILAPLTASSRGLGEAILAALDLGADEIAVGVGGSASTDGGAGLIAALGARVLDAEGRDLPDGGGALADVARLDLSGLDPRLAGIHLVLAADVDSPLLGPRGAAAVFAPQKGATPADIRVLEAALTRWSEAVAGATSTNRSKLPHPTGSPVGTTSTYWSMLSQQAGAGAAGGVGFALLAVLGAERRSGVEVVLDLVGIDDLLAGRAGGGQSAGRVDNDPEDAQGRAPVSDRRQPPALVVTGEGALDAQTLTGKAITGVTRRAEASGIPVVAVCGRLDLDPAELATLGVRAAYPLSDLQPNPAKSMADAAILLRRTGRRIAREWLSRAPG